MVRYRTEWVRWGWKGREEGEKEKGKNRKEGKMVWERELYGGGYVGLSCSISS
jgi:hypothetical protein